jgi:molybdenum cofactor cytidylyltransferase
MNSTNPSVDGVILAAGLSKRAGTFKPALQIGDRSMINRCIEGMDEFCRRIIVVGGHEFERLRHLVGANPKVECIENPLFGKGMFSSVKSGLSRVNADRCFVLPVDIPLVPPAVFRRLLSVEADVVIPSFQGRNGHPVCLSKAILPGILSLADESSLRDALHVIGIRTVEVEAEEILLDVDTPGDLELMRRRVAGDERGEYPPLPNGIESSPE